MRKLGNRIIISTYFISRYEMQDFVLKIDRKENIIIRSCFTSYRSVQRIKEIIKKNMNIKFIH